MPATTQISKTPFPIRTNTTTVNLQGKETTLTAHAFTDKILLTITQQGRLAHWIHVPLATSIPEATPTEPHDPNLPSSALLPLPHFTATTILGGANATLDTLGQLLATQVASAIIVRDPEERRMLVLGLGLDVGIAKGLGREGFEELVGGCLDVL